MPERGSYEEAEALLRYEAALHGITLEEIEALPAEFSIPLVQAFAKVTAILENIADWREHAL